MRLSLGSVNLALLSLYFAPVWGIAAVRALVSPYHGLEDGAHAAAASYFRQLFDLGFNGLILTSHIIAGVKLVIAAGFVAYAIEFARALVMGRDADRETLDVTLTLAVAGIAICALPAFAAGEPALVRLYGTQVLMVICAIVLVVVERHGQKTRDASRADAAASEREAARDARPPGPLSAGPTPAAAEAAIARIPEAGLHTPSTRS